MALLHPELSPVHVFAVELQLTGLRVVGVVARGIIDDVDALFRPTQRSGGARVFIGLSKLWAVTIPPRHGSPSTAARFGGSSKGWARCDEAADPRGEFRGKSRWPTHGPRRGGWKV